MTPVPEHARAAFRMTASNSEYTSAGRQLRSIQDLPYRTQIRSWVARTNFLRGLGLQDDAGGAVIATCRLRERHCVAIVRSLQAQGHTGAADTVRGWHAGLMPLEAARNTPEIRPVVAQADPRMHKGIGHIQGTAILPVCRRRSAGITPRSLRLATSLYGKHND